MDGERTGAPPVDGALQQAVLGRHASPWREVVHIEMQVNSHGRDCYWLHLGYFTGGEFLCEPCGARVSALRYPG